MQIDAISTLVMSNMLKDQIRRSQNDLTTAQREFATGRHADMGLALGARTGRDLMWRAQLTELQALRDGNTLAGNRLDLVQSTLNSVRDVANVFVQTLTGARDAAGGQTTAKAAAAAALASLTSLLNTSYNGQALFGGINSDVKPIADYDTGQAKTSVDAAFFAAFGITQSDPAVSTIGAAGMQAFLDAQFAALFQPAQWQSDWSQASGTNVTTRIDTGLVISTGTNANLEAFRNLAQAFTMVLDLGTDRLNGNAFEVIADKALKLAGQGVLGIGFEQARLGIAESEITAATGRITLRMTTITGGIGALEDADKYEAAMRVNALQSQLEASYTLTGRISRLSILNYV